MGPRGYPVRLEDGEAQVHLRLQAEADGIVAQAVIRWDGEEWADFECWSPAYVLVEGQRLLRTRSLGRRYQDLQHFNTRFAEVDLERYLTLLYSTLHAVKVHCKDYQEVVGADRLVEPALVFEELDDGGNLNLRIGLSMTGFDRAFVESYELSRAVAVNEVERTLVVAEVVYESVSQCLTEVEKGLKKVARRAKSRYYQEEAFFWLEAPCVEAFLRDSFPALLARYRCFGAESLTRYKVRTSRPTVRLEQVGSGIDYLSAEVTLEIDDQSISLTEALKHFRQHAYIPLNDGSHAVVNPEYLRRYRASTRSLCWRKRVANRLALQSAGPPGSRSCGGSQIRAGCTRCVRL